MYCKNGLTALLMAVQDGYSDIVKFLIEPNANVNMLLEGLDRCSALILAAEN